MGVAGEESLYTSAKQEEGDSLYCGPSTVDMYLHMHSHPFLSCLLLYLCVVAPIVEAVLAVYTCACLKTRHFSNFIPMQAAPCMFESLIAQVLAQPF